MTEPQLISVIHLIAHPELYAGRKVRLVGFCVIGFEGEAVYVTEADYRAAITKNGVWLDVPLTPENLAMSETMALVEGTFDATSNGHLGLYSGTIRDVTRLAAWSG